MRKFLSRTILVTVLATGVLAGAGDAHAAPNAYLKVKGDTQGDIKGGVTQKGHEGQMRVLKFSQSVISPRDAASGLPTGKRQHKPLVVTIEVDKSFPLFFAMLANNENISQVSLPVYAPSKSGKVALAYQIDLTNANLAAVKLVSASGRSDKNVLELEFTYQKITWMWANGGITAEDDWEAPEGAAAPHPKSKKKKKK